MQTYSNTKLKTFSQCRLQYQYRYLDRIRTDLESVEAYTGKRVHETLEWLYQQVGAGRTPTVDEVLADYEQGWHACWHPLVFIVKQEFNPDAYRRRGARCLENFYRGTHPFDADETIALEAAISFVLDEGTLIRGYIDRVARGPADELIISDYKTSSYLPQRQELLADLQLAIYQIGATERWPGLGEPQLVWHFLTFGRKVTVQLGEAIADRREELRNRVAAVESALAAGEEMTAKTSRLCDWCSYKPICPAKAGSPERAESLVLKRADKPARRDKQRAAAALAGGDATLTPGSSSARSGDRRPSEDAEPSDQMKLF